ncbi:MAG: ABC transporter permease [Planctomycetes bacterium]|nr:ABC transporter permease [Planctomycetota bacterium]
MTAYVLRRLLALPPLLVATSFIVFVLMRSVPGDPVDAIYGEKATADIRRQVTERWGLDRPVLVQYGIYMKGILTRGDFGESYVRSGQPISREIARYLPATVELTLASMFLATFGGILLGVRAAVRRGKWDDFLGMAVALLGVSVPVFWLGLLLLIAFGEVFAVGGAISPEYSIPDRTGFLLLDTLFAGEFGAFLDVLRHLALPATALATIPLAMIARITRGSMLEVLGSDYVRTARAKGLAEERVVMKHAFKNAALPIVTLGGLEFGYLLGGAVLTESVFAWPGMGRYILDSIAARDYLAVSGALLVLAAIFVLVNLAVDLLYAWLDPRIRYG